MNPVYDNSVPFYPTIPNQIPIPTFFPNQVQHHGHYSREAYAPHFPNAGYSNPAPQNVPYPAGFGDNSNRSVFFPAPNQRPVYPTLGINAPMYPNNHHNLVHPAYYPNSSSGISCTCGNPSHNPGLANSNHAPSYPGMVHVGNLIYQLPNPHSSAQFNPSDASPWPRTQNNTYYQPANQVSGNSTNAGWNYHPDLNQNTSAYTQSAQNPSYAASHNYNHAAAGNNRSWLPYSNQNTFRPIPEENNDNWSEFSFDPLSTPSDLNLLGSTPDLPAFCENVAVPIDPVQNVAGCFSLNSSQCTLEVCGTHTDINQNQAASATNAVSSLDQPTVREEAVPTALNATSLADSIVANGDQMKFDTPGAICDKVRNDSTITAGQASNIIPSTPVSTTAQNGTEPVLESNDLGLNKVPNSSVLSAGTQNIQVGKASEKDQTDSIAQIEKNSGNVQKVIEPKSDEWALKSTTSSVNLEVENRTTSSTSVHPRSSRSSPMIPSKETDANPDRTSNDINACPTILKTEVSPHLSDTTDSPNTSTQPKPQLKHQILDSSTVKPNYKRCSPTEGDVTLPTQISTNFRHLLIRFLNRLDNVMISTDPDTSYLNIDDELINSFIASLNSENHRVLQQNLNTGLGNVPNGTQSASSENQATVSNTEKKEADQNAEPEPEKNQENGSNSAKKEADRNADTEPEKHQVIVSSLGTIEADKNRDTVPAPEQCNVLLHSCADREETPVSEENTTESQQHVGGYQSADDVDVINMNLDTIEVTVGDTCNNSVKEECFENVPLDLAKEKKLPEPEPEVKSRYFEVSQFLPKGNVYWQYFDTPSLQQNPTIYAAIDNLNANDPGPHSVDVLVEVPLNLTCKNRPKTAESQTEDIASNYPELALLLNPQAMQSSLNSGVKNGTKNKEYCIMKKAFSKLLTKQSSDVTEPPKKKICVVNTGDAKVLHSILKNDKPNM